MYPFAKKSGFFKPTCNEDMSFFKWVLSCDAFIVQMAEGSTVSDTLQERLVWGYNQRVQSKSAGVLGLINYS